MKCCVTSCSSLSGKECIKFCRCPSRSQKARRDAWAKVLRRSPDTCDHAYVCERHFTPEDWEKLREDGSRRLRLSAVPSQNLSPNNVARNILGDITNRHHSNIISTSQRSKPPSPLNDHLYCKPMNRFERPLCTPVVPAASSSSTVSTAAAALSASDHPCANSFQSTPSSPTPLPDVSVSSSYQSVSSLPAPLIVSENNSDLSVEESFASSSPSLFNSTPVRSPTPLPDVSVSSSYQSVSSLPAPLIVSENNSDLSVEESFASSSPSLFNSTPVRRFQRAPCTPVLSANDHSYAKSHASNSDAEFQSALDILSKLEEANKKLKKQSKKIEQLDRKNQALRKIIEMERKAKSRLENKIVSVKKKLSPSLSQNHIEALFLNYNYSNAVVEDAIFLKSCCGTNGYEHVARRFNYPSSRTLQRKTAHIKFDSGLLHEVFERVKLEEHLMSENEHDAMVAFDELAIEPNAKVYDPSLGKIIGGCTLDGHTGTATKGLVFALGGISSRWKLAALYELTNKLDPKYKKKDNKNGETLKERLFTVVSEGEKAGLKVHAAVSDMGADNRALWRALGIKGKRSGEVVCSIVHPCDPNRRLHFLPDTPHLFKAIAAMIRRNKFIILPDDVVKANNLPTCVVDFSHLNILHDHENKFELKIAPNLRKGVGRMGHFEKMNMGSARALISHKVQVALRLLARRKKKAAYITTAFFVDLVNRWFTLVTSRYHKTALSLHNEEKYKAAIETLKLTSYVFQTMEVGFKKEWKPAQEGVMIATQTILELQEYFLKKRGYKFLLTSRFTQDFLENLFSQIRRRQAVPNALQLKNILKELMLSKRCCKPQKNSVYEFDEGDMLLSLLTKPGEQGQPSGNGSSSVVGIEDVHCPPITNDDVYAIIDDWELTVIYDMAGCALHRMMKLHTTIPRACICVQKLLWRGTEPHPLSEVTLEKNYKPGALKEVSDELFHVLAKCEIAFRILREPLQKKGVPNVVEIISDKCRYAWGDYSVPDCHNIKEKIVTKYVRMRLKQYGTKNKEKVKETGANYNSKTVAGKAAVTNMYVGKDS